MAKKTTHSPAADPVVPAVEPTNQPAPAPAPVPEPEPSSPIAPESPPAPPATVSPPVEPESAAPAAPAKAYTTPTEGAKPMKVTRSDHPELELVDSFVDTSEAIRCYIIQHGAGPAGSKFTFTSL